MGGYPSVLVGSVSVCHFKINEQTYSRPRLRESTYHLGLFNDVLMNKLAYETNLKSMQRGKKNYITKEEILTFLGINMIISYHHLPAVKQYWPTSSDVEVLPIKKAMTRETFKFILGNLHVNDNHKMDKTNPDKLYKIIPLLDHLISKFNFHAENLSLDESLIKFKKRSSLKQYNPMKPIKRGYKIWCLSDNDDYFQVYVGT